MSECIDDKIRNHIRASVYNGEYVPDDCFVVKVNDDTGDIRLSKYVRGETIMVTLTPWDDADGYYKFVNAKTGKIMGNTILKAHTRNITHTIINLLDDDLFNL